MSVQAPELASLFSSAFSEPELRRFISATFGREIANGLQGAGVALGELAFSTAELLIRHGLVRRALFVALRDARPELWERIHALWQRARRPGDEDIAPPVVHEAPVQENHEPPEVQPPQVGGHPPRPNRHRVILDVHDGLQWDDPAELSDHPFSCVLDASSLGLVGVQGSFKIPWTTAGLHDIRARLRAHSQQPVSHDQLRRWGTELRRAFTNLDGLEALLRQHKNSQVELVIRVSRRDLISVPWELLVLDPGPGAQPAVLRPNTVLVRAFSGGGGAVRRAPTSMQGSSVIFAWSDAGGAFTKLDDKPLPDCHHELLNKACAPHGVEVREVPRASLSAIRAQAQELVRANRPPRVLHVLCHGVNVGSRGYGLGLHHPRLAQVDSVSGDQIRTLLESPELQTVSTIVLCACDSANPGSTFSPIASVAAASYHAGVNAVASQLPLTQLGSEMFTAALYPALLSPRPLQTAHNDAVRALHMDLSSELDWLAMTLLMPDA